jgi:Bacterial antitoxin of type II TA system, VapB
MRITVDIEEGVLRDLMKITGDKNKSPAVAKAVGEFVRRAKAREFGRLIRESAFDYPDPVPNADGQDAANPIPPLYPA